MAWWAPHHHDGDDEAVRMKRKEGLISSITTFHNETRRAFTVPRRGRSWLEVLLWIHTHPLTISLAHTHAHTNTHGRFKVQEHLNTHVMGHNAIAYKTEGHFSFNRIRPNRSWWECGRREVISECGEWRGGGGVCGSIERECVCACEWAQRLFHLEVVCGGKVRHHGHDRILVEDPIIVTPTFPHPAAAPRGCWVCLRPVEGTTRVCVCGGGGDGRRF